MNPFRATPLPTAPGAPEVWRVDARWVGEGGLSRVLERLPTDERARCLRYRRAAHRLRYAGARWALRTLLAERLGLEASRVTIRIDPWGKPVVPSAPMLAFSLAHAGSQTLIALSDDGAVGVDLETACPSIALESLVRCLSAAERQYCGHPPVPRRVLQVWCGKEAVLKAAGCGLAVEPSAVETLPCEDGLYRVSVPPRMGVFRGWRLTLPDGGVAALALGSAGSQTATQGPSDGLSSGRRCGAWIGGVKSALRAELAALDLGPQQLG